METCFVKQLREVNFEREAGQASGSSEVERAEFERRMGELFGGAVPNEQALLSSGEREDEFEDSEDSVRVEEEFEDSEDSEDYEEEYEESEVMGRMMGLFHQEVVDVRLNVTLEEGEGEIDELNALMAELARDRRQ